MSIHLKTMTQTITFAFILTLVSNFQNPISKLPEFVNKIVNGNTCNGIGAEKYVQNFDGGAAYNVTVKIDFFDPGVGSSTSQKVVQVPAGGKTYLGCSVGVKAGVTYTYSVVGESKK